jgi:hypothetical protein
MRAALFGFYETHSILLTIHPKARSCFAAGSVGSPPQDVSSLLRAAYAAYRASALLLGSQRSRFTLWAALGRLSPLRFDCPPWATPLTRCYASLRLPRYCATLRLPTLGYTFVFPLGYALSRGCSLPHISPFGLPAAGYPASARWHVFAPAQLIRRISRPAPPSELPCGSLSRPSPKVSIRPSGQPSVSLSRACPGARLSSP